MHSEQFGKLSASPDFVKFHQRSYGYVEKIQLHQNPNPRIFASEQKHQTTSFDVEPVLYSEDVLCSCVVWYSFLTYYLRKARW